MPISTIMLVTVGSAWIRWDSGAAMPIVAATEVSASRTGTPAAISAPKASSMSTTVIGRLMPSAECRSLGDAVVDRRVHRDVTGLTDPEVGVGAGDRGGAGLHLRRVVDGALQVHVDQRGSMPGVPLRRGHVGDARGAGEAGPELVGHLGDLG